MDSAGKRAWHTVCIHCMTWTVIYISGIFKISVPPVITKYLLQIHCSLIALIMKLSNDSAFHMWHSRMQERKLFWLENHKAQVVQPAAWSLVLVGCTPALGLFRVLSLVLTKEEWQEGIVDTWQGCSLAAAVSGWHLPLERFLRRLVYLKNSWAILLDSAQQKW